MPTSVQGAILQIHPPVALHFSNLSLQNENASRRLVSSVPVTHLRSLATGIPHSCPNGKPSEHLQKLILAAANLDTLRIYHGDGFMPTFASHLDLPSVTKLSLAFGTCDWRGYEHKRNPWQRYNCPKVENIFIGAPIPGYILAAINPGNPANLRSLVVQVYSDRLDSEKPDLGSAVMAYNCLLQNTSQLVVLEIATLAKSFPVSLFCGNQALRSLRLQDLRTYQTEKLLLALLEPCSLDTSVQEYMDDLRHAAVDKSPFPTISLSDLNLIARSYPCIEKLDLGIDRESADVSSKSRPGIGK